MWEKLCYEDDDYNVFCLYEQLHLYKIGTDGHEYRISELSIQEIKSRFLLLDNQDLSEIKVFEDEIYLYLAVLDKVNLWNTSLYQIDKNNLLQRKLLNRLGTYSFQADNFNDIIEYKDYVYVVKALCNDGTVHFKDGELNKSKIDNNYIFTEKRIRIVDI